MWRFPKSRWSPSHPPCKSPGPWTCTSSPASCSKTWKRIRTLPDDVSQEFGEYSTRSPNTCTFPWLTSGYKRRGSVSGFPPSGSWGLQSTPLLRMWRRCRQWPSERMESPDKWHEVALLASDPFRLSSDSEQMLLNRNIWGALHVILHLQSYSIASKTTTSRGSSHSRTHTRKKSLSWME